MCGRKKHVIIVLSTVLFLFMLSSCSVVSSEKKIQKLSEVMDEQKMNKDGIVDGIPDAEQTDSLDSNTTEDTMQASDRKVQEKDTDLVGEAEESISENEDSDSARLNVGQEKIVFQKGTVRGNVYTNKSLGISFKPGSIWEYTSEEVLAEQNGLAYPLRDADIDRLLENDSAFIDLIAKHSTATVSVTVYQPKMIDGIDAMNEEELIHRTYETALDDSSPESLVRQLKLAGVSRPEVSLTEAVLQGEKKEALKYSYTQNGRRFTGLKVLFMNNNYMFEIAARSKRDNEIPGILELFSFQE